MVDTTLMMIMIMTLIVLSLINYAVFSLQNQ